MLRRFGHQGNSEPCRRKSPRRAFSIRRQAFTFCSLFIVYPSALLIYMFGGGRFEDIKWLCEDDMMRCWLVIIHPRQFFAIQRGFFSDSKRARRDEYELHAGRVRPVSAWRYRIVTPQRLI